jgi:ATP adenylyltransferase
MDYLWTPWRYKYIATADRTQGCVFCDAARASEDERTLIVHRGKKNFIILNRYPYTSGHVMIVPYAHIASLPELEPGAACEMMEMAQTLERALQSLYNPEGYNIGMNIGRAAGAGIAGHLHMHVLPRWTGDTSFITTVSETRVEPEELSVTYRRLHEALRNSFGRSAS